MVLLDPADGHLLWQTYLVPEPTLQPDGNFGPSGAAVWSTPSYDHESHTLYVTTGNNYSQPTTGTSDAIIALDAADGHIKWVNQRTPNDEWNFRFLPETPEHPDVDFGDSPQIYRIGGQKVVSAGQKSGFYHVVDAATGAEIGIPQQFVPGGQLGGYHMDAAYAQGAIFANANDWPDPFSGGQPVKGMLTAIAGDGSHELWSLDTPAPILSGVAVANGVVYAQSLDGSFYAVDAATGHVLALLVTGGQSSGPSISRGQIYLGAGDALSRVFNPFLPTDPGAIIALGLDDVHGPAGARAALAAAARPFTGDGSGSFISANFDFLAAGIATHLGTFSHSGNLGFTPTDNPADLSVSGRTVYVAANGDRLYAILAATLNVQTGAGSGTATWDGGTGRFADARGIVDITAQLFPDGSFTFSLVGYIGP